MKYCASCGSEYQDSVKQCADCPGHPMLVDAEQMRMRGLPLPHDLDRHTFVRVGIAENPLAAEAFATALHAAGIPVLLSGGRSGIVDELTTGNVLPWWELRVPEDQQARALELLEQERARELATADEAARAAEEEERESELSPLPPAPPPM